MEQAALQVIPWQGILNSPGSAWAVVFILLLVIVMYQNGRREERLGELINNTLAKQTEALTNVSTTMVQLKDTMCEVKYRVESLEGEVKEMKGEIS